MALVRTGDMIKMDAEHGILEALVPADEWAQRQVEVVNLSANQVGMGRELFAVFRNAISAAEEGATIFALPPELDAATVAVG